MYQSLEAQLHDAFWQAEGSPAELPLLREFLNTFPGKALELGSGSGRLLHLLAKEGFPVEGLDNSPEMIALSRERYPELSVHEADLDQLQNNAKYHSFLVPAFTLQLLPDPAKTLQKLAEELPPNGALYLSSFIPWAELNGDLPLNELYLDHRIELPDGDTATVHTQHDLDLDKQILVRNHTYTLIEKAVHHSSQQIIHYFFPEQIEDLLHQAGFKIHKTIFDFDPTLISPQEEPHILTHFAVKTHDSSPPQRPNQSTPAS